MAVLGVYSLLYFIPMQFLITASFIIILIGCKKRKPSLKLAHSVARKIFNMKAGPNDHEDKPETLLLGYVVPHVYINQILMFSFTLCCYSLIIFWDAFLIEESYVCNPNIPYLHCYADKLQVMNFREEELDCSNTNKTSVYCYQVVLDFSSAAGSATGVFLMASIVFAWLLLYISKGKHGTRKQKRRAICVQLTEFVVNIILLFIFPYILNFGYFKYKHIIVSISFFFTLILSIGMPWWSFYKPEDKHEMSSHPEKEGHEMSSHPEEEREMSSHPEEEKHEMSSHPEEEDEHV